MVVTPSGLVAATAGGPVVTSVVPSMRLRMLSVLEQQEGNTADNLLEERAGVSNVVNTFTIRFQVTQKQTLIDVGCHCSFASSADVLL